MAVSWTTAGQAAQFAANVATVVALVYAAITLNNASNDAKMASSVKVLEQGNKIEADYRDGKAGAREVVAFYYQVFLYRRMDRLVDDVYVPVNRGLCKFMTADPRAKENWASESAQYDPKFVAFVNGQQDPKLC